jgi:uncharacterized protein
VRHLGLGRHDGRVTESPPTFLVIYTYVADMKQRRVPHRQDHLAWLCDLADRGTLLVAGATREPVDTGVLVLRATDVHEVRRLLLDDPYGCRQPHQRGCRTAVRARGGRLDPARRGDHQIEVRFTRPPPRCLNHRRGNFGRRR